MNINIDEAWDLWEKIDNANEGEATPEMDAVALLIPGMIYELQSLRAENRTLKTQSQPISGAIVEVGDIVWTDDDDDDEEWSDVEFVVCNEQAEELESYDPVVFVKEFATKFEINEGDVTYVEPKVEGNVYTLRKVKYL